MSTYINKNMELLHAYIYIVLMYQNKPFPRRVTQGAHQEKVPVDTITVPIHIIIILNLIMLKLCGKKRHLCNDYTNSINMNNVTVT